MSKYRVVSVCWVDVYADDIHKAHKIASDIYYNMSPEEHDDLPSLSFARPFGDDGVTFDGDDAPGWWTWHPSNDPF